MTDVMPNATHLSDLTHDPPQWLRMDPAAADPCAFLQHGLLVLKNIVPREAIEAAATEVDMLTTAALRAPLGESSGLFGDIREPLFRCDVKLCITERSP